VIRDEVELVQQRDMCRRDIGDEQIRIERQERIDRSRSTRRAARLLERPPRETRDRADNELYAAVLNCLLRRLDGPQSPARQRTLRGELERGAQCAGR
jgi:hypothetical protein